MLFAWTQLNVYKTKIKDPNANKEGQELMSKSTAPSGGGRRIINKKFPTAMAHQWRSLQTAYARIKAANRNTANSWGEKHSVSHFAIYICVYIYSHTQSHTYIDYQAAKIMKACDKKWPPNLKRGSKWPCTMKLNI